MYLISKVIRVKLLHAVLRLSFRLIRLRHPAGILLNSLLLLPLIVTLTTCQRLLLDTVNLLMNPSHRLLKICNPIDDTFLLLG